MSMTDPIADLLTRIRNGHMAKHETIEVPQSRIKLDIVKILEQEGYVESHEVLEDGKFPAIRIALKYDARGRQAITGIKRVSRPGRRVYCGKDEVPQVLNGLGVTVLSTSRGLMTGAACRRAGVGGEVLCSVW